MESIAAVVPLTIATAKYEHRGEVKLPENDTLAWLDETMEELHESRSSVNSDA